MIRHKLNEIMQWARQHKRRVLLWGGGGLSAILLLVQLLYPSGMTVPFSSIDGRDIGAQERSRVTESLNADYKKQPIALYFGSSNSPYRTLKPADIGLTINNAERVEALEYPLWLRIIPTSIFWAHTTRSAQLPKYTHNNTKLQEYMVKELGQSCDVAPKNASLAVKESKIIVINSEKGGTCKLEDVSKKLKEVSPILGKQTRVNVPVNERAPVIDDSKAKELQQRVIKRIEKGVMISAGTESVTIPREQLLSWLTFETPDKDILVKISPERSTTYFAEQLTPKVSKAAGVSKVTTQDFTEISRVDGASGQTIDTAATLAALSSFLTNGGDTPRVATKLVAPRIEYTRSYSPTDTGLSALLKQYAESHPGTFGISLIELSGQRRRASFQDTLQFRTASTYKLFVAYGTLKRVESGTWKWSDQIQGGRSLEKCFDDMIVKSDNPCGEALLAKIGFRQLTDELKAAGLTGSSFMGSEPLTTAGDLSTFNASLESGQLVSSASRTRLLDAMKRNIYRQGIPAGASGMVADKVGFLDAYLHDAAIIYTANGPIVLSIMTSGSSWATIADLTRQIEALRSR
ncbi:serine hydrolase [Candidatus Saccharibacteria bacterium]|nr:serine hydrolase [Candidatus Saccharibacteria bacterium]